MTITTHNSLDSHTKSDEFGSHRLATELENSIPIDFLKRSAAEEINAAAERLLSILKPYLGFISKLHGKRRGTANEKMIWHLKIILINLLVVNHVEGCQGKGTIKHYISFSRDKNEYSKKYKNINRDIAYRFMISAVDVLTELGFIEVKKGFFDRKMGRGRQSRMRATERLIELVQNKHVILAATYRKHALIILRKNGAPQIDVSNKPGLHAMADKIKKINDMLVSANIQINLSAAQYSSLISRCHFDPSFQTVYRVFNNDLNHGGRFYGHWVHTLPREYRAHLTLAGEHVVELDYSSIHPRILYRNSGNPWPTGDLYEIHGVDCKYRKFIKVLMNAMINARNEESAINSMFYSNGRNMPLAEIYSINKSEAKCIASKIKGQHHVISHLFCSGIGLKLQKQDSDIAQDVMLYLLKNNASCIPVHDSFIVASSHYMLLFEAMRIVSAHHLGQPLPVAIKHGQTHLGPSAADLFD